MPILDVPVDEVILQPDNAIIRRKCKLELVRGRNVLDIGNLDPDLDANSLQFIISGKSVVIHNMRFAIQTVDDQQKIKTQRSLKSDNLARISELESMIEDIDFLVDLYDDLREDFAESFATAYAKALVNIGDYLDFYNLLEIETNQHVQKKEELQLQVQGLTEKNVTIDNTIKSLLAEEQQQKKGHLTLIIESEEAQTVDVQLEYLLQAGNWNMFYELEHEEGEVTLTKWVTITNTSKEPWQDVSLTLTDKIRAELSLDLPKLVYMDPEEGIESDFLIPVQSILLPSRVTILNNGEPYKFEIGQEKINSLRYLYYWNASEFADVVEIIIINLKENYLYPAKINIFHEGIFIDTINHMDFTPPAEEVGIALRIVKTIRTSKQALSKEIEEAGVLKRQVEVDYSYVLSVTNPFDKQIDLAVYEKIPKPQKLVPGHSLALPLNVDYERVSRLPHKVFENGLVRWDLKIAPKKQQEIDFSIHLVKGD